MDYERHPNGGASGISPALELPRDMGGTRHDVLAYVFLPERFDLWGAGSKRD